MAATLYADIVVCWELIKEVGMSDEVTMPTDAELCSDYMDNYPRQPPSQCHLNAYWPISQRHLARVCTTRQYGVRVGSTPYGEDVWASLISSAGDCYATEALYCAIIGFVRVGTLRGNSEPMPAFRCFLDGIAEWNEAIQGHTLAERYASLYDALVRGAKGDTG
ncbi:hypothetical protein K504DRAFT_508946 [Pleomassaria siparia CBS 279.74]|uniref:Uncharacterized protein n=1 Tax=Pleomassaria siparia CBS 279.74 TaxID=1314801 RepID=A0A6G1JPH1_9PLEO|nr:hypothetical protein K504DRAFT_508946 [Pleomassaria siparia CBS 279.74]